MAKPQTENGFVMIALDLFAAIMVADLPNRCMIVLSYHLIHSYGPAKKREVFLDPIAIEEHTRLHRNNVRRAVKELSQANMIERMTGGAYRFNKDYESWTPGGHSFAGRLNGGPIEFAAWALQTHGVPMKASKKDAIQPDSPAIQLDCVGGESHNPTGLRRTPQPQSNGIASDTDSTDVDVSIKDEAVSTCDEYLACERGRTREEGEDLEILDPPLSLLSENPAPNIRRTEDYAEVCAAMRLLASYPATEGFAHRIGREHNKPENISLPGWKWCVAAYKLATGKVKDSARGDWKYFMGIVRNSRQKEYDEVRDYFESPQESTGLTASPSARASPPRKQTHEERRRLESETTKRLAAALPDDEDILKW